MRYPVRQWERESQASLRRAQERRSSPHPWPGRGQRAKAAVIAVCLVVLGYAVLIGLAWVATPAVVI